MKELSMGGMIKYLIVLLDIKNAIPPQYPNDDSSFFRIERLPLACPGGNWTIWIPLCPPVQFWNDKTQQPSRRCNCFQPSFQGARINIGAVLDIHRFQLCR